MAGLAANGIFRPSRPSLTTKPILLLYLCYSSSSSSPLSDQIPSDPDPLISSVVSILTNIRSKSRWGQLRSLYPSGFTPTHFSQISLQIKNNPHLVLAFFKWSHHNATTTTHNILSYSTTNHILACHRLKSQAFSLIRDSVRLYEPLQVFKTLLKTYRQCGSAPFVFDHLIKACLECKKFNEAVQIVRMLLSRGNSPGLSTCNGLIRCVMRRQGAYAGYEIYREVFGLGDGFGDTRTSGPNVQTFNELMLGFYQDGAVEMLKEIWDQMAEFKCCPDVYSYCILMESYCSEDETMSKAEELWEKMREKNVEPDIVAYNIMIGGFSRVGRMEKAEEFFKLMGLSGIEGSGATCGHLVKGYCKIGKVESALLLYKDMLTKDFRADSSTVDELIRGLCDKSMVSEALEVMRVAKVDYGFFPKQKSYEFLIRGLCEQDKLEEALKLQVQMVGKGFKPNSEIYGAFISGYLKDGKMEVAELLRKEMLDTELCAMAIR